MALPMHVEGKRPTFAASSSVSEYLRRMLHYAQMDIDYTIAQMIYLCVRPRQVYQLTSYRKQTKNQWARDDPAFVVVLVWFLTVSAIAYGLALRLGGSGIIRVLIHFVGVQFAFCGAAIATFSWALCNKYLRVKSFHGVDQQLEWMYAFDIHCNSFFPLFIILYVVHYMMLPFLVQSSFLAMLVGNALYAAGMGYYFYITSLGYSTLPFLERTEMFLYPAVGVAGIVALLTVFNVNITVNSLSFLI
eukprot:TRINITY_DN103085_c0_g1_i1.p1 TRINITY_DN103085_c0_g1~~TRINITY_DN103085_c0_g1_i1.p1  ORF type:complete len:246 (+),score=36.95 TRINITY_DN103085_c0_g1_i1:153-890(+)